MLVILFLFTLGFVCISRVGEVDHPGPPMSVLDDPDGDGWLEEPADLTDGVWKCPPSSQSDGGLALVGDSQLPVFSVARKFGGHRHGMAFKLGPLGRGYYPDVGASAAHSGDDCSGPASAPVAVLRLYDLIVDGRQDVLESSVVMPQCSRSLPPARPGATHGVPQRAIPLCLAAILDSQTEIGHNGKDGVCVSCSRQSQGQTMTLLARVHCDRAGNYMALRASDAVTPRGLLSRSNNAVIFCLL